MRKNKITELIKIANRAKSIGGGDYTLPNDIFASLLEYYFSCYPDSEMSLFLETDDPKCLDWWANTYYDLFTLQFAGESICLPLPKLKPLALGAAMKMAIVIKRQKHNRNTEDADPQEITKLRMRIIEILGREEIIRGMREQYILSDC